MHSDHITLVKYIEELHTIYPIYENVCNQGSNKNYPNNKKISSIASSNLAPPKTQSKNWDNPHKKQYEKCLST
jgi:hypothetical protein